MIKMNEIYFRPIFQRKYFNGDDDLVTSPQKTTTNIGKSNDDNESDELVANTPTTTETSERIENDENITKDSEITDLSRDYREGEREDKK